MAHLSNICKKIFLNSALQRNKHLSLIRTVSTSGKKSETQNPCEPQQAVYKKVPDFTKPVINDENWISFGFHRTDRGLDKFRLHFYFFTFISVLLCGCSFIIMYFPDRNMRDWARREAFIRLHEREQLGLDPIDANFIDPSQIILPPDEELKEEDIVI